VGTPNRIAVLLALLLVPVGLRAQQGQPAEQEPLPAEAQALALEIEQIHARLEPVQDQALADPEIRAAREALSGTIASAIERLDPGLADHLARYSALEGEVAEAQAAGDQARIREIFDEAALIERRYEAVQASALSQPEVAVRVQRFQARLLAKMTELEPQAGALVERLEELDTRLHTVAARRD
jgi:chromosome segregation ATPase